MEHKNTYKRLNVELTNEEMDILKKKGLKGCIMTLLK